MPLPIRGCPRLDHHWEIVTPNGHFYRWGKDEPRPENVHSGGAFSTSIPGGHDTASVALPRKPGIDYSDLTRLSTLRAIGPGGKVRSEVRLANAPRTSGDIFSIDPEAEGWRAHLEDDSTAAEVYRDVDLASWVAPGRARLNLLESENLPATGSVEVATDPTTGLPSLRFQVEGAWASVAPRAEAWYDAGPNVKVLRVYFRAESTQEAVWVLSWRSSTSDVEATQVGADLWAGSNFSGNAEPSEARRFFAWVWTFNTSPGGADGKSFAVDLRNLAVYGDHGLPLQGAEPEAGFLASDVIADAIRRWAPLLSFTTGSTGTIRPSSFVIPQLAFKGRTTTQGIIDGANRFELRPYAVWEGPNPRKVQPTFYYHDWGDQGRRWRARVAPTQLAETGPSIERLRNGVIMQFQDVDGSAKFAGPLGSGCDIEDAALEDRDPENPANERGIKRYGEPIDIGTVSVASEVVRVGSLCLERLQETDSSGQAQIVGTCGDDRGVVAPASEVRAGDYFEPIDASDKRPRRIVRTNYNEDTFTNTIDLDAPPDTPADLFAQLGASVASAGF